MSTETRDAAEGRLYKHAEPAADRFGMRANAVSEAGATGVLDDQGIDLKLGLENKGPDSLSMTDLPTNGALHMGHALNKVLKDVNKYQCCVAVACDTSLAGTAMAYRSS